ncbi:GNAT family N-acetyltransferase [Anaerosporobacter sp.]
MVNLFPNELEESMKYICGTSSIYFSCILKGEADGIIWANRKDSPDFLLVWSPYQEGFQLMGQPLCKEEWKGFRTWFVSTIIPFLIEQGMDYFEYGADTKALADMFQNIFADIEIFSSNQKMFHWSSIEVNLKQPKGYRIEKVDRVFLQKEYQNKESIINELERAYGGIEPYFEHGVAYVALYDNRVVARADMLFSDNGYGNISVNTEEAHRRKGLSVYLAMKTIKDTCKLGLIPVWDCTDDNLASEKAAKKCGFQMIREDPISWFNLNSLKNVGKPFEDK